MVTAEGQATRRAMRGFAANRSPGGKGKIAMRSDQVVAAAVVPVHQNPARGVDVMNVRGDTVAAITVATPPRLAS